MRSLLVLLGVCMVPPGWAAAPKIGQHTEEELKEQLAKVPELRLYSDEAVLLTKRLLGGPPPVARGRRASSGISPFLLKLHHDLAVKGLKEGLPLRGDREAQMNPVGAQVMGTLSKELRKKGFVSIPLPLSATRTLKTLRPQEKALALQQWCDTSGIANHTGALSTLMQMLQVEDEPLRLLLVRELGRVKHRATTLALTQRAVFDLSPGVREEALSALTKRNPQHYLPALLEGLQYPWPPVAEHAALAICQLKPEGAEEKVREVLEKGDPMAPFPHPKTGKPVVRELVKLNHLRNCALCHSPSASPDDPARGFMPIAGEPLPHLYYEGAEPQGDFVRADITFLHQHFSVNLKVPGDPHWPEQQRFDFITRLRPARPSEVAIGGRKNYPQLIAIRHALDQLTAARKAAPGEITTIKKPGQLSEQERMKRLEEIIKADPPASGIDKPGITDKPAPKRLPNVTTKKPGS